MKIAKDFLLIYYGDVREVADLLYRNSNLPRENLRMGCGLTSAMRKPEGFARVRQRDYHSCKIGVGVAK